MKSLMNKFGRSLAALLAFAMVVTGVPNVGPFKAVEAKAEYKTSLDYKLSGDDLELSSSSTTYTKELHGFKIEAGGGSVTIDASKRTFNIPNESEAKQIERRINMGGSGSKTKRVISFDAPEAGTIYIGACSGSDGRNIAVEAGDSAKVSKTVPKVTSETDPIDCLTFDVEKAGKCYIYPEASLYIFYIEFIASSGSDPEPTTYTVSCNEAEHGTITADPTVAKKDDEVTITGTPESDEYFLESITVNDGEPIIAENNEVTFAMPAEPVVVNATFTEKSSMFTVSANVVGDGKVYINDTLNTTDVRKETEVEVKVEADSIASKLGEISAKTASDEKIELTPVADAKGVYTFTMPAEDVFISAEFVESESYTVSCNAAEGGSVVADKSAKVYATEKVTLTVTADAGYKFTSVSSNEVSLTKESNGKYSFIMPAENVNVTASFEKIESVDVKFDYNGHGETKTESVNYGEKVTKPEDPTAEDLDFVGWYKEKAAVIGFDFEKPVTEAVTLYAVWVPAGATRIEFPVTIDPTTGIPPKGSDGKFTDKLVKDTKYGSEDKVYFVPGDDMLLKSDTSENAGYMYQSDVNPTPALDKGIAVETAGAYFDVYSKMKGRVYVDALLAENKNFYITEVNGSTATLVKKVGAKSSESSKHVTHIEFNVDADKHYQVALSGSKIMIMGAGYYVPETEYAVNIATGIQNGKVVANKTTAKKDATVTLTVTPDADYELETLKVMNGTTEVPVSADNTFKMPENDVTVIATFKAVEKPSYSVSVNKIDNGKVEANKSVAKQGEEVILTVTPDAGYELETLTVMNGKTEVPVSDNKFTMPAGNVIVTATFKPQSGATEYTITVAPATNGTVTANKSKAVAGDTVTLTVKPDAGYELGALTVMNGKTKVPVSDNKFTMPAGDVTVTATFKEKGTSEEGFVAEFADGTPDLYYTGVAQKPAVSVRFNGEELIEGTDYTLAYANNTKATITKKATATVTGKGNYSGKAILEFAINQVDLSGLSALPVVVESGKNVAAVTIIDNSGVVKAAEYTFDKKVKFTEDGKLTVTAKETGNYKGAIDVDVYVKAKSDIVSIKSATVGLSYYDLVAKKAVVNSANIPYLGIDGEGFIKDQLVNADGTAGKAISVKGIDNSNILVSVPDDITSVGKHTVVIYGAGYNSEDEKYYTGTVTKTYTVKAESKATLTVSYDKDAPFYYNLDPAGVTPSADQLNLVVTATSSVGTNEDDHAPIYTNVLTSGVDYDLTYANQKAVAYDKKAVNDDNPYGIVAKAQVKFKFKGNYAGSKITKDTKVNDEELTKKVPVFTYMILPVDLSADVSIITLDKVAKKAGAVKSAPYVLINNCVVPTAQYSVKYYIDKDCKTELTAKNATVVDGVQTVYVKADAKANKNVIGSITGEYKVVISDSKQADISKFKAALNRGVVKEYNGDFVELDAKEYTITDADKNPIDASDITVTFINNLYKGKAIAIISSNSDKYFGSKTFNYDIKQYTVKTK